ncbi:porin [Gymnodinialimonas ceratoperidinii]|uniref:Porin n=1 Tax=Gymnodinialimonas ceratoperidinii TaxID=2856823 RepID=A0A8F6TX73_9RHOB|nr:porin [Gymnodinialimonas ceratoperidinii]QXT39814.1 porin [Gymnodinialimonas ceratoperidinii]
MKKVLFASTALVATAGVAAADVALSGSAEMGVFGGDMYNTTTDMFESMETQFHTDIDVTFTLSGESDGGITFGAAVDLDENAAFTPENNGGIAIFISGDFGTLTMGDTDGALDWALTEAAVGNAGSIQDNETGHVGYVGSYLDGAYDGQILRYDYSFGDFAFAASVEMDDDGDRDNGYAIGAMYNGSFAGGSYGVGIGYQVATPRDDWMLGNINGTMFSDLTGGAADGFGDAIDDVTALGVSANVALDSGFSFGVTYTQYEAEGDSAPLGVVGTSFDTTHVGVGAGYTFDAITVSANYGMIEIDNLGEFTGYGVAAAYDLGGGLSAHLGYGSSDYDYDGVAGSADATVNTWSFGLAMSF